MAKRTREEYEAAAMLMGGHYAVETNSFFNMGKKLGDGMWWEVDADTLELIDMEEISKRTKEFNDKTGQQNE